MRVSFVFQEGDEETATPVFKSIAEVSGGKHFKFAPDCLAQLSEALAAIAKFATGGVKALSKPELLLLGRS